MRVDGQFGVSQLERLYCCNPLSLRGRATELWRSAGEVSVGIKQSPIPPEINAALPTIRSELIEYLNLEENESFGTEDIEFKTYVTIDDRVGFVIFEYVAEEGPGLAFLQCSISGKRNDGCIVSWPRTSDQTIEWSILEYLEYNPLDED